MPGANIDIQDLVFTNSISDNLQENGILIENLDEDADNSFISNHNIPLLHEINYISSFVKWSTVGATASAIFANITNLVSVSNKAGEFHYKDSSLTSTLTTLTDGEVYKVVLERNSDGSVDSTILRLINGQVITESGGAAGFDYTFSTSSENWFPWSINKSRFIDLVMQGNESKITRIINQEGVEWLPSGQGTSTTRPTNALQLFVPGQGYIITVSSNFSLKVLSQDSHSGILDGFSLTGGISSSDDNNLFTTSPTVSVSISESTIKDAISQITPHSSIAALQQSEVDRYRQTASIPSYDVIQTFYAQRGLEITFNTLMKLDDTYSATSGVYNRADFQADYNAKLQGLRIKTINYKLQFANSAAEVLSTTRFISANEITSRKFNFKFNVLNPVSSNTSSKVFSFQIITDGATRRFANGRVSGGYDGLIEFKENLTISNTTHPIVDTNTIHWKDTDRKITIEKLFATNPT
jgi:hypothetical protein